MTATAAISHLRPIRSVHAPVTSCPSPHTAGQGAAMMPIRVTESPARAKKRGKTPEASPSLRLFTKPEVDLHDDRGRPGQPLVDPEQHVGGDDPTPARPEGQQERDGHTKQPARPVDRFAAGASTQSAFGQRRRKSAQAGRGQVGRLPGAQSTQGGLHQSRPLSVLAAFPALRQMAPDLDHFGRVGFAVEVRLDLPAQFAVLARTHWERNPLPRSPIPPE